MGGIRSTGVSASLGIADFLSELVCGEMQVEPSRGRAGICSDVTWQLCDGGQAVRFDDSTIHPATHPMFLFGHQALESKL